jgi:hypothetical protein
VHLGGGAGQETAEQGGAQKQELQQCGSRSAHVKTAEGGGWTHGMWVVSVLVWLCWVDLWVVVLSMWV